MKPDGDFILEVLRGSSLAFGRTLGSKLETALHLRGKYPLPIN